MSEVVARIDDFGRPAWIALMVIGFIVFWPIGLAILAYIIWSGRMGCSSRYGNMQHWRDRASRALGAQARALGAAHAALGRHHRGGLRPTGNRAFDEYRDEALRRLEGEANEFRDFLERLRMAKDREEFDEFMNERRNRPSDPPPAAEPQGPAPQPQG